MPDAARREGLSRTAERCLLDGDLEGAVAAFTALLDEDPENAQAWANVGFALADAGHTREAVRHFERALEIDPRCAAAWVGKGMRLEGQDALRCFERAIEAAPTDGGAWFLKSCVLEEHGRSKEAAECLARARELSPGTYG